MRRKKADLEYEQSSSSEESEQEEQIYTKSKRKPNLKNKKKQSQSNTNPEVVSLITTKGNISHERPPFLKRWDGQSNFLEILEEEYRSFPPSMEVYWREKSQYMRAVIFVQFGYMDYHVYENDAILFHELFGKNVGRYSKYLVVKLYPSEVADYTAKLYKMNIAMRFLEEVEDKEYRKKYKIIKRVVKRVINPGVHIDFDPQVSEPSQRFLLSLYPSKSQSQVGVAVIDTSTNTCYIEQSSQENLRRILNKFKPVEIVIPFGDNKDIKKTIKQVCDPYLIELHYIKSSIDKILEWGIEDNHSPLFTSIKTDFSQYQENAECESQDFLLHNCLMAVDLLSEYFKKLNVWDQIIPTTTFQLACFITLNIQPVFDSQVYQNLEVFEIKNQANTFGQKGTLYAYLNKCRTKPGERKLRQWINSPLTEVAKIKERQSAIQELLYFHETITLFHDRLKSFPDFETKTANIYHWLIKNPANFTINLERNKEYEQNKNPLLVKAKQIRYILENFKEVALYIQDVRKKFQLEFLSQLLGKSSNKPLGSKKLIQGNLAFRVQEVVEELFQNFIVEQNGTLHPKMGLVPEYDKQREEIEELNEQLSKLVEDYQKELNIPKMKLVSVRARNEIQFPKEHEVSKSDSKWFHLSSFTQKVMRCTTLETVSITEEIIEHQKRMDLSLVPFLNSLVAEFSRYKFIWSQFIDVLSEFDVLLSLTEVSFNMDIKCIPQFVEYGLEYERGLHVGLAQVTKNVVRNSIQFQSPESVMLITGPNMGGKSTLLRQTCLLAIIAQIGCMVPAASYQAHPFDQIFCRIGASDRLHQGKSTFYVEMEQTKHITEKATKRSLVIIDELGRGTSTFDGVSIAVGVLKDLVDTGCITLFSTHHSLIADQFQQNPKVRNKTVDYEINEGKIVFKYQLKDGVAEKSFAVNVAKMAGIPDIVLRNAEKRSSLITKESESLKEMQVTTKKYNDLMTQVKEYLRKQGVESNGD